MHQCPLPPALPHTHLHVLGAAQPGQHLPAALVLAALDEGVGGLGQDEGADEEDGGGHAGQAQAQAPAKVQVLGAVVDQLGDCGAGRGGAGRGQGGWARAGGLPARVLALNRPCVRPRARMPSLPHPPRMPMVTASWNAMLSAPRHLAGAVSER